jgi:hypothetical protein
LKIRYDRRLEEKEKIKGMSPEDRQNYFEEKKKTPKVDIWTEMVNEGVVSQAEADLLKETLDKKEKAEQ